MKKLVPVLIIGLAVVAFFFRGHWLPGSGEANYLGYVEGETVLIAAPVAGRLVARPARKGDHIAKGQSLFSLDTVAAEAEVIRTEAAIKTAEAQLANLLTGKREPELDAIRAQRREAEASLILAQQELDRSRTLVSSGTAPRTRLEQAQASVAQYEARIAQFRASEQAGMLAARGAEIDAARSSVTEAQTQAVQARQKLADLSPASPVDGNVEDTFFDAGEWVTAGQPIVSLLARGDVTLRFFVPETALAKATPGAMIHFICDGCGEARAARITHVAASPEFTPPVIYSQQARAKLVFLVEASPAAPDPLLRPGLPIEVEPLQ